VAAGDEAVGKGRRVRDALEHGVEEARVAMVLEPSASGRVGVPHQRQRALRNRSPYSVR